MDRSNKIPTEIITLLLSILTPAAPSLTSNDLTPLAQSPALLNALLKLGNTRNLSEHHDKARELLISEQKVANLRTSIAHLTTRLSNTTSRLAAAEASISAIQHQHAKALNDLVEERDGVRALCSVWEARWREERRVREDLEAKLANGIAMAKGKLLNDRNARAETSFEVSGVWKPIVPSSGASHSRHSSSASSSTSSSSEETHLTTSDPRHSAPMASGSRGALTPRPRIKSRQLIGDLARELERVRREADHLLFERDEEIVRLETEQAFRKQELGSLYGSLDTLLSMGHSPRKPSPSSSSTKRSANPVEVPLPDDSEHSSNEGISQKGKSSAGISHRKKVSVIDEYAPSMKGKKKSRRTEALETEVRELEREVAQLGGFEISEANYPNDHSVVTSDKEALASTILQLNSQVSHLRSALREMTHERALLQSLYDERQPSTIPTTHFLKAEELERECQRLSSLLSESHNEIASLTSQLLATQDSIEVLSTRVRTKLLEQKEKLQAAQRQVKELSEALQHAEKRAQSERSKRKALTVERMAKTDAVGAYESAGGNGVGSAKPPEGNSDEPKADVV